ncbi:MAG TPA: hypothetical protein VK828_21050 [Terriglobales bacterium]|jgi:hypothetical protein|nr:hypothetical protein [Terriglobales bacterium]
MNHFTLWPWAAMFLLGAYHGVNPGMGWLFATALGMQKKNAAAVGQALVPIAVGHFIAIGLVVAAAVVAGAVLPLQYVKIAAACVLFGFGLQRLIRKSHRSWGGMQIGFRDLCIWSFLMASAHGAGFMLLPILLKMSALHSAPQSGLTMIAPAPHLHGDAFEGPWTASVALFVHTLGYLLVTGLIAVVVYEKVGLEVLRKAWVNLDLIWAVALIVTAGFTLLIPT